MRVKRINTCRKKVTVEVKTCRVGGFTLVQSPRSESRRFCVAADTLSGETTGLQSLALCHSPLTA